MKQGRLFERILAITQNLINILEKIFPFMIVPESSLYIQNLLDIFSINT